MWRINEFGRLGRYSLVLVCYIGTDKLWWIKWCADYQQLTVCTYVCTRVQWDLSIKDTLVPAHLSTVERLSTLQR